MTDLDDIRARLEAATKGPWEQWVEHAQVFIGPASTNTAERYSGGDGLICTCDEYDHGENYDEGHVIALTNAAFIAHAPTDIATLLSMVESLTREREHFHDLVVIVQELAERRGKLLERWLVIANHNGDVPMEWVTSVAADTRNELGK